MPKMFVTASCAGNQTFHQDSMNMLEINRTVKRLLSGKEIAADEIIVQLESYCVLFICDYLEGWLMAVGKTHQEAEDTILMMGDFIDAEFEYKLACQK